MPSRIQFFLAATCVDATQEELFHAITQYGYANACKKIFGELPPTLNSKIQLAMDKARYEWGSKATTKSF